MMLGGPDVIEPAAVGQLDLIERVLEQRVLGFPGPRPGKLMFVKPAKFHSYKNSSGAENSSQYFGTLGSTLSLHAIMPPFMFLTFLKPACFRTVSYTHLRAHETPEH